MRWKPDARPASRREWTASSPSLSIPRSLTRCSKPSIHQLLSQPNDLTRCLFYAAFYVIVATWFAVRRKHECCGRFEAAWDQQGTGLFPAAARGDHAPAGILVGPSLLSHGQHARLLAPRRRHLADGHRLSLLGRTRLHHEAALGTHHRSRGCSSFRLARPAPRLDAVDPDIHLSRLDRHVAHRSPRWAGNARSLRSVRCVRLFNPGH